MGEFMPEMRAGLDKDWVDPTEEVSGRPELS